MSIAFDQGAQALESILTAHQMGRRRKREREQEREEKQECCNFGLLIFIVFLLSCTSPTGIGIVAILSFVSDDG